MNTSNPAETDAALASSLRDLLVCQFELHELRHHPAAEGEELHEGPLVPKAHLVQDIYKCLHQGEFGVGHSIQNPQQFGNQLARELLQTDPLDQVPTIENVSLDGKVFRINLGPYRNRFSKDINTACALLLRVCLNSASLPVGNSERFLATLKAFRELNKGNEIVVQGKVFAFPPPMLDQFLSELDHFIGRYGMVPVLSHSPMYKKLNAPAYRVADVASLEDSPLAVLLKEME